MGTMTDRINGASPKRLLEIAADLLAVNCGYCDTEKEDVKDARSSLRDYVAGIKAQLIALGVIGGGAAIGWKAILAKLTALGLWGAVAVTVGGLLIIWLLYEIYSEIAKRVKELRAALNALDDCLQENNCN